MGYSRKCSSCPYSTFGRRDSSSDICDGCTSDGDTGWYGEVDHSFVNEDGYSPYFKNANERKHFMETLDDM